MMVPRLGFSVLCFVILASVLMMPGCIFPPPTPPGPGGNTTPTPPPPPANTTQQQNQTNVTIVVSQQENQTIQQQQQNYTQPPPTAESKEINYTDKPDDPVAVYFIYVGDQVNKLHGDAILIKKGDLDVLVDAGPAETSNSVLDFLSTRNVDDVDVLISTNADPRHYGGIGAVAAAYRVEEFWWNGRTFNDAAYSALVQDIAGKAKTARNVSRGFSMALNGMEFQVLNPGPRPFNNVNNDAIVLRVEDRNFSAVLLSGVLLGAQSELLSSEKNLLMCDAMQAPYYGLGTGTSGIANFLTSTKPNVIVISGGPDESPISGGSRDPFRRLLNEHGIQYIENYASGGGTVRVYYDGESCAYGYLAGATKPC